jgi:membrane protease YdiL (CAAX protease family)
MTRETWIAGAGVDTTSGEAGQETRSAPLPRFGPVTSIVFYIAGYILVGIVLTVFVSILFATLVATGLIEPPSIDLATAGIDPEKILELLGPLFFPLITLVGVYSILYTWAFVRLFDRRPFSSLGIGLTSGWRLDFGRGLGLAALLLGVVFLISLASGGIAVVGFQRPAPPDHALIPYLLMAIVALISVGIYEELMFRGYILQRLTEKTGPFIAVIVSSLIFAILHMTNPGAGFLGLVNTWVIGALLCSLYFRSRSLWLPIGFHFGWNFLLGFAYSLPVSGLPFHGILEVVELEPKSRLAGGIYGPEGGFATLIALALLAAWLIWKRTKPRR